ncbi:MAG: hypothetical protein OEV44_12975 [Spirochaetota bacterium]|nr:hypothetical protein [Spirochaetota bacterium]
MFVLNLPLYQITGISGEALSANIPQFLIYFFAAFISYFLAIYNLKKKNQYSETKGRKKILILIFLTILMRVPFFLSDPLPSLSDDIYRYWWDGKVQYNGNNPFEYPPIQNPQELLTSNNIDDYALYGEINHPEIPTIYAPFMQTIFYAAYSIHPSVMSFKIIFALFDLLTIVFIILWLKKIYIPKSSFIIYAWNPLLLIEFYHNSHSDSLLCLLIVLVLYLYNASKKELSIITLSFLTLTKYFAIIFLPFYYKKVSFRYFIIYFIIIISFYIYYFDKNLFIGLFTYSRDWEYNSFLYKGLSYFFNFSYRFFSHDIIIPDFLKQVPKLILGIIFLWIYWKKWKEVLNDDSLFVKNFYYVIGCLLLFSPVFHPWYISYILPILVIYYSKSWIIFSGLISLSYITLIGYNKLDPTTWQENIYVVFIEYIPLYSFFIIDYLRSKRKVD